MDMLEKSQKLAQSSQQGSVQEKTEREQQQIRIEESLKIQVNQLKKDNIALRSEMDRIQKCSGCTGDLTLRSKLLQEIERLEATGNTQESKLHFQIQELTQKLSGEVQAMTETQRKHDDDVDLQKTIVEKLRRENTVMSDAHKREANDLRSKLDLLQSQLSHSTAEVGRLKLVNEEREKQILRLKSSTEDIWSNEQHSLLEENSKFVKLLEDKERLLEAQLKALQTDKDEALKVTKERQDQLVIENQNLQAKLQSAVRLAGEKDFTLQKEIERIRRANFAILEASQTHEEALQVETKAMRTKLEKVKKAYVEREKSYTEEVQGLRDDVERLHRQIFEIESQESPDAEPDVVEALRNEVNILERQLSDKTNQLEALKEKLSSGKPNQRPEVELAIEASQKTLEAFKNQQAKLNDAYSLLQEALGAAGQTENEAQMKLLAELKELIEENARLNLRVKETDRLQKDNEAKRREVELMKQDLELATRNWKSCESALKETQMLVDSKAREDPSFTQADLLSRTTLENQRLIAELQSLTEARSKLEEAYSSEANALRSEIQIKGKEIDDLKNQIARLKSFRTKKSQEELAAWQVRQVALEKTIKALETEVEALKASVDAKDQVIANIRDLEGQEMSLLRLEVLEKEAWAAELKRSGDEEKADLRVEVRRLRDILKEIEIGREKANKAQQDALAAMKKHKDSLKKIEDDRLRRLEGEREVVAQPNTSSRGISRSKANPAAVTAAREEAEAAKAQFANEKLKWSNELQEAKLMANTELESARQVEAILNRHVKAQQDQLKSMTQTLEEVRALHAQEIKTLRRELAALRKASGAHTQLMISERKTLAAEIERVVSLTGRRRDTSLVQSVMEKVLILQSDLATVKAAYENSIRLDPSNIDDVKKAESELSQLKEALEKAERIRRDEREEISEAVQKIKSTVHSVQTQALTERDLLANESEVLSKNLQALQTDADLARKQRDDALETLSKVKNIGKLERTDLTQLMETLKSQERTSVVQLQDEYMRLIQQQPVKQTPKQPQTRQLAPKPAAFKPAAPKPATPTKHQALKALLSKKKK